MNNDLLLSVRQLKVTYSLGCDTICAVEDATFDVPRRAIVGLVGESGCGKSTVARALTRVMAGNARIEDGTAHFDGTDMFALSERDMNRLRWRDIAFVPQSAMNSLDPVYTIKQQLLEVLKKRGGYTGRRANARAAELFEMVGIEPGRLSDYPHQFSGGMRQRAAIALALALEPKLIIADEPVTALDVIVQRQILDQLKTLQDQLGLSVILITHDISVVAYVCDRVVVMYAGRVAESGDMREVLTAPQHPYTMGLCNAFPDLRGAMGVLTPIEGSPPDLTHPPPACRFEPRCPFRVTACSQTTPNLAATTFDHQVACHRVGDADTLRQAAKRVETWSALA